MRKPDKFQAVDVQTSVEVVEVPHRDDDRLREAMKTEGITLAKPAVCRTIFKLADDRWIGPFDLVPIDSDRWILPNDIELEAIPVFDAPVASSSQVVCVDGVHRTILLVGQSDLAARRFFNWQSDADVLRGMLKRLRKLDQGSFRSIGLTNAAFDAFVAAVENAGLLPDQQLARERARMERVKRLQSELPLGLELVEEIMSVIEGFGAVKQRIEVRLAELGQERKSEIEAQIVGEKRQLNQLQQEIARLRRESEALAKQLSARRKTAEADLVATDAAIQEKVQRMRDAPARTVAELLASSSIFSALFTATTNPASQTPIRVKSPTGSMIDDVRVVIGRLAGEMLREGVNPVSALPLLAAFAVGMVPVCGGDAAIEALHAVSRCICAGNTWLLPLSPVTTSLADILAPPEPRVAGLRHVIETAHAHADELFLVILNGIDLGVSDGFLLPLVELADRDLGRGASCIPLISLKTGETHEWPDNLLLAVTVSGMRTALPLPCKIWERAPLFLLDWLTVETGVLAPAQQPTRVLAVKWRELRASIGVAASTGCVLPTASPPARRIAARLHSALRALSPDADAQLIVQTHVWAPAFAGANLELPPEFSPTARTHFQLARSLVSEPSNHN